MKSKLTIKVLMLMAVFAMASSTAWAVPVVDGDLDPNDEYPAESELDGNFSKTYSEYVVSDGFYIINDWFDPCTNYDPNDYCDPNDPECDPNDPNDPQGCDAYNIFTWTDEDPNPWHYWRIKCHGNGAGTLEWRPNDDNPPTDWEEIDPDTEGFETATGYNTTKNDPTTPHPIWELKIPYTHISADIEVGMKDPKWVDPNDCPGNAPHPVTWNPPTYDFGTPQGSGPGPGCD